MSFRMYVLNIPSQYKLNYMAQEGKTDQSVQAEFDKVMNDIKVITNIVDEMKLVK